MHSDIHLRLHHLRAEQLHQEARAVRSVRAAAGTRPRPVRPPHPPGLLRRRVGWGLVELGLRLVTPRPGVPGQLGA
ncbi:hypothetical protein [Streptomyces sp. XD-27]|uniref:hypothetical protein n=1 Tax=Streptomyces sp. XD-27 TaxID=3062779 RepID=UPI0026F41B1C|nr:hypothetical protein [Streptomyces sp. XD-27]WKX70599.1 hypothetical protein Q3Y56_12350 [Streptomyces sp. XD-27]